MDIFDNQILCKQCKIVMNPCKIEKNGFILRALKCKRCQEMVVHPVDKQEYDNFIDLKKKQFNVKMRMVGNSYAVSIPRQIVDFIKEQERVMDNMVKLCFEDANKLSLMFNNPELKKVEGNQNSRIVRAREVKVVKNGKPIVHTREFSDSAHPKKNQKKIFRYEPQDDR